MQESLSGAPLAAIVLAGGRSARMGRDKATLCVDGERLLSRTVRVVAEVASPVIVVAGADQESIADSRVEVERDERPHEGPLVALVRGLQALGDRADHAFVCGTDHPRLVASVVARLHELARGHDAAVALIDGEPQLLCAVFGRAVVGVASAQLARGKRSMRSLVGEISIQYVTTKELLDDPRVKRDDPRLLSFVDVDTPDDLRWLEQNR